jgi:ABC-2 type transport system ATP-binding protein
MVQPEMSASRESRWNAVLELRGLTRRYGDLVALDDLSFTVGEGQMFGFVGPNGAGKTTAMRIVLGVLQPDAGEVRWRGRPMTDEIRKRVGYMPEERGLYPKMRVRTQLEYLARLHGLGAAAARRSAGHWIGRLGLGERASDRVEALSLGNQQRVQLAAALVHDPELLVLDEPFSGLDPVGVDVLAGVLQAKAAAGTPVIFSSHQLELVERLCEAVAIVNRGRLVASGAVAELRSAGRHRHLEVGVSGAAPDWTAALPGVRVVDQPGRPGASRHDGDGRVLLELDDGADEQAILDAARAAGRVTHFSAAEPTLADLFREAVRP